MALAVDTAAAAAVAKAPDLPPFYLDGAAWWDEFHLKVRLGHAPKHGVLLCRHPDMMGDQEAQAARILLQVQGQRWVL